MLMSGHIDAAAAEGHAFTFEAQALLQARVAAEEDAAAGAHDAMPR